MDLMNVEGVGKGRVDVLRSGGDQVTQRLVHGAVRSPREGAAELGVGFVQHHGPDLAAGRKTARALAGPRGSPRFLWRTRFRSSCWGPGPLMKMKNYCYTFLLR